MSGSLTYFCENNPSTLSTEATIGIAFAFFSFCCLVFVGLTMIFLYQRSQKTKTLTALPSSCEIEEGRISILRTVGQGFFGKVYEGLFDTERVALKTVSSQNQEEIENEWKLLESLHHPHIIRFFGVYHHESTLFIVCFFLFSSTAKGNLMRDGCLVSDSFASLRSRSSWTEEICFPFFTEKK